MKRVFYLSISLLCVVWIGVYVVVPVAAYWYYKNEFMVQTAKYSLAMDETWYIEQVGSSRPNKAMATLWAWEPTAPFQNC